MSSRERIEWKGGRKNTSGHQLPHISLSLTERQDCVRCFRELQAIVGHPNTDLCDVKNPNDPMRLAPIEHNQQPQFIAEEVRYRKDIFQSHIRAHDHMGQVPKWELER